MCEERLAPLLSPSETLSEEEAARLGKKDPEQEVGHLSDTLFDSLPSSLSLGVCNLCVSRWRSFCPPTLRSSAKTNGCVL